MTELFNKIITEINHLFFLSVQEYGYIFGFFNVFQEFVWGIAGIVLVFSLGVYFTVKSRFLQFSAFPKALKYILGSTKTSYKKHEVSPVKAFFASLGGCVGVGNLVTISLAIHWGGPGAIFWMWIIAFLGVMLKYSEIYLGITFRKQLREGVYVGGPMYFLQEAFPRAKYLAYLMAFFMCIYGVEIFMFKVIQTSFAVNFNADQNLVAVVLLVLVVIGVQGGINRIGGINAAMIPLFVVVFLFATAWVLYKNFSSLGLVFSQILNSAFTGHAAIGGFAGASVLITISNGIAGACYSGDIAIGYESIMHSSAKITDVKKHASLSFLNIFLDTFIVCTCTALIIVVTGMWHTDIEPSLMLQRALENYFPYLEYIMPVFIFMLAYTTIISYFQAGLDCANFISPKYGKTTFYILGMLSFVLFSFFDTKHAAIIMYSSGAALMLINSAGIYKLRKHIKF